ncbi:MAG TPA: hypothetical protein VE988_19915 [Gemmataceae bacterium]|nr:hypothetical protein [Gemmataceae bacterium]
MYESDDEGEGAEGAGVFPLIPAELGVNPLLLATLHAVVFIDGSTEEIVCPESAGEAMNYLATYLNRLKGPALASIQEDMKTLLDFGRREGWNKDQLAFLKSFLTDNGIGA